jgi:hypothetical protein
MREFDDLLNEVLQEDAKAEPRVGMERRILTNVMAQGTRSLRWQRWLWVAGASLAACLVVVIAIQLRQRESHGGSVLPPQAASIQLAPAGTNLGAEASGISPAKDASARPRGRRVMSVRAEAVSRADVQDRSERLPKLDTFPAVTQRSEPLMMSSPKVAEAVQELKAKQEQPLVVAAIEIKPL